MEEKKEKKHFEGKVRSCEPLKSKSGNEGFKVILENGDMLYWWHKEGFKIGDYLNGSAEFKYTTDGRVFVTILDLSEKSTFISLSKYEKEQDTKIITIIPELPVSNLILENDKLNRLTTLFKLAWEKERNGKESDLMIRFNQYIDIIVNASKNERRIS